MKLRAASSKWQFTTSYLRFCTGFVVFLIFKLSAAINKEDFGLYALVPPTAAVVFAGQMTCVPWCRN